MKESSVLARLTGQSKPETPKPGQGANHPSVKRKPKPTEAERKPRATWGNAKPNQPLKRTNMSQEEAIEIIRAIKKVIVTNNKR
jgi:hypothetical protein